MAPISLAELARNAATLEIRDGNQRRLPQYVDPALVLDRPSSSKRDPAHSAVGDSPSPAQDANEPRAQNPPPKAAPPTKRPVGRPRKNPAGTPLKNRVTAAAAADDDDDIIVVLPKRKGKGRSKTKAKMPASTTKRVKGKRIERPFIIGSEAIPLTEKDRQQNPEIPADHTKRWRVYVRAPEGQPDITRWLKRVTFKIFHTYANSTRVVEHWPYEVRETGWGGFNVDIRLHFAPEAYVKAEWRTHFLQLEPYGDEEQIKKQESEGLVRSEFLDFVEFNEPTEAMWDLLTDESQFGKKAGGKGAKAAAAAAGSGTAKGAAGKAGKQKADADEGAGTVELPDTAPNPDREPFSKDLEQQLLDVLARAEKEVDQQLEAEKARERKVNAELMELRGTTAQNP